MAFTFPQVSMIPKVLMKLRQDQAMVIAIILSGQRGCGSHSSFRTVLISEEIQPDSLEADQVLQQFRGLSDTALRTLSKSRSVSMKKVYTRISKIFLAWTERLMELHCCHVHISSLALITRASGQGIFKDSIRISPSVLKHLFQACEFRKEENL